MAGAKSASSNNAAAWSMALLVGVLVGALAPRIAAPGDRAAGEPFVYTPPAGFVPATEASSSQEQRPDVDSTATTTRLWAKPVVPNLLGPAKYRPQISQIHTPKRAPLEDSELAAVAAGLPAMFAPSGITWSESRHWTHVRPGGARVGVIAGEASRGLLTYRMLQMAFPEDTGTSIVTASYPSDEASTYETAIESSIDQATGVAFHAPPLSPWAHLGWGAAAALLTLLAMGLRVRKPTLAEPQKTASDASARS